MRDERGKFVKGSKVGRPKGAEAKLTRDVREAILAAFDKVGGPAYLVKVAQDSPQVFCALLGKILPSQIALTDADGTPSEITVKFVRAG